MGREALARNCRLDRDYRSARRIAVRKKKKRKKKETERQFGNRWGLVEMVGGVEMGEIQVPMLTLVDRTPLCERGEKQFKIV